MYYTDYKQCPVTVIVGHMVEDIHLEAKVNFRVMGKDGETLFLMYDDQRENLISPLPTRCSKVRH